MRSQGFWRYSNEEACAVDKLGFFEHGNVVHQVVVLVGVGSLRCGPRGVGLLSGDVVLRSRDVVQDNINPREIIDQPTYEVEPTDR